MGIYRLYWEETPTLVDIYAYGKANNISIGAGCLLSTALNALIPFCKTPVYSILTKLFFVQRIS